jgi:hypothetical protein
MGLLLDVATYLIKKASATAEGFLFEKPGRKPIPSGLMFHLFWDIFKNG